MDKELNAESNIVEKCRCCGGVVLPDPEGEAVCGSCGAVAEREVVPVTVNPYYRSPLNHGVVGKNLGTSQREVYSELSKLRQVSGAVAGWDLDDIDESDKLVREEIMWFTDFALRKGYGDVNIDPVARMVRGVLKDIQEEERRLMVNRVKTRFASFRDQYLGLLERQRLEQSVLRFLESRKK